MMLIGLTGSMASGKSTVAHMLQKAHIPVIDADELAREACLPSSPALKKILETFGVEVLNKDGTLNRAALAELVFDDPKALQRLEAILHPAIHELYLKKLDDLKAKSVPIVVYMAPLLFEKNLQGAFDKTILVTASDEVLEQRALARDQLSLDKIKKRLKQQMSTEEKIKRADEVIDNNGTKEELLMHLQKIWYKITKTHLPI